MKRKLVQYEVFEEMKKGSLTSTIKELTEAGEHLSSVLGVEELILDSFDETRVVYNRGYGNYIQANYSIENGDVKFENVEEIIIDEDSEKAKCKELLSNVLEAVIDEDDIKANSSFEEYMKIASVQQKRKMLDEAHVRLYGTRKEKGKSGPKVEVRTGSKNPKKVWAARKGHILHKSSYKKGAIKRKGNLNRERARRKTLSRLHGRLSSLSGGKQYSGKRKKMNEWANLSMNVFGYIDFVDNGHIWQESSVITNENGDLTVTVPGSSKRNANKVIQMKTKGIMSDVKVLRETALRLRFNPRFCEAVATVKRFNNMSDNSALEEAIGNLIAKFPSVIYLAEQELAGIIGEALHSIAVTNFDDNTCTFMAEGILRMAHETYPDKVTRIRGLANAVENEAVKDRYEDFQKVATGFFKTVDESASTEMKIFEDLFDAITDIRQVAIDSNNETIKTEASELIEELDMVLSGQSPLDIDLAFDAADWVFNIVESNVEGGEWNVNKTPHVTISGDHPNMAKLARHPYTPASDFSGNWGDPAPVSDGKSYRGGLADEMRGKGWGNMAGKDMDPDLRNPYLPDASDFTMKGEQGVDKDGEALGSWSSGDTWPDNVNPYLPASVMPKQKVDPSNSVE